MATTTSNHDKSNATFSCCDLTEYNSGESRAASNAQPKRDRYTYRIPPMLTRIWTVAGFTIVFQIIFRQFYRIPIVLGVVGTCSILLAVFGVY